MGVKERRARQRTLLRQEILDAARDILVRDGYEGLSMRKVAEKIDYTPTAIYLHFKDRDELVFQVCEELMGGLVRELQRVEQQTPDPIAGLRNGLRRYIDFGLAHREHYTAAFIIPHANTPAIKARYHDPSSMSAQAFGFLVRIVSACIERQKIAPADPLVTSRALWAAIHGITALLIAMPGFDWGRPDDVIERLVDLLLAGLQRR
jgi:AcrR family transcriptional regulator